MTEFTIIIPTFNRLHFLKEAVNSLSNELCQEVSLLIIDNFSTDGTLEYLVSLKSPFIEFVRYKNDGSVGRARNFGVARSSSQYICFLDSDDLWIEGKIEELRCEIKKSRPAVLHHDLYQVDSKGFRLEAPLRGADYGAMGLDRFRKDGNKIFMSSVCVHRKTFLEVNGFDEDHLMLGIEDADLWYRMLLSGKRFIYLPSLLGKYRSHSGNTNTNRNLSICLAAFFKKYSTTESVQPAAIRFESLFIMWILVDPRSAFSSQTSILFFGKFNIKFFIKKLSFLIIFFYSLCVRRK